jgi:hypothetical protein
MSDGSVKFVSSAKKGAVGEIDLPCGQCIGCRLERSRQWAVRCLHESSLHQENSFITLTYDDSNIPPGGSLRYDDFQRFMKRLRKFSKRKITFYMGGEYGEQLARPHYHACIFGYDFPDKVYFSKSSDGSKLYTSAILGKLWPYGMSSVGSVTFASAAYIARYCVSKVNGDLAKRHYETITDDGEVIQRVPEFNHMSLKPAIGKRWLDKYMTDVYPRDYVIVNGVKTKPPAYYDTIFEKLDPGEFSEIVASRELDMQQFRSDNTFDRLAVKEAVKKAASSFLKRSL